MISKDQSQTLKINVGWQELRKRSAKVFEIKMKKKTWNVNERQDSGVWVSNNQKDINKCTEMKTFSHGKMLFWKYPTAWSIW